MDLQCAALSLSPFWQEEQLLLVRRIDAVRLCRDGEYEELPRRLAETHVVWATGRERGRLRDFVIRAHLVSSPSAVLDDRRVIELLRASFARADLAVVRRCEGSATGDYPELAKRRRLAHAIGKAARGPLVHDGRKVRLVADVDLPRMPDRDHYAVVPRNEASLILEALAKQADPGLAALFVEARGLLSRDWRPPLSPDGLVLLRALVRSVGSRPRDDAPFAKPRPAPPREADDSTAPEPDTLAADVDQARQAEANIDSALRGAPFCEVFDPAAVEADDAESETDDDQDAQAVRLATASREVIPFCEVCRKAALAAAQPPPPQVRAEPDDGMVVLDDDQDAQAARLAGASHDATPFCEVCARVAAAS